MSARSELRAGFAPTYAVVQRARFEELLDQVEADARAKALAEVTMWLVKKAREFRAIGTRKAESQANAVSSMASKISRGAVRPNNLRMLPEPGFFEAERTYRSSRCGDFQFRCLAIEAQPETSEVRAVGWRYVGRTGKWTLTDLGADDWACCGWTDVTGEVAS
ncbi:hypothetical protein ACWDG1_09470 [Streptomyces sp. NPDC001177]